MSDGGTPLERLLDRAARVLSGSGLHPLELMERIRDVYERSVRGDVAPNRVTIVLHPDDVRTLGGDIQLLEDGIVDSLEAANARAGRRIEGSWLLEMRSDQAVPHGAPSINAGYADARLRPRGPASSAPTRRLSRHDGVVLVLSDGNRVPVTHTPFSIGRAPGNDLVIPSLAISRTHARVMRTASGFEMVDAGSRNGIEVNGRRVERAGLFPGIVVTLGDTTIRLEYDE